MLRLTRAQAYADYEDVMKLSEDLLSSMVLELKGSYKIQYHAVSRRCSAQVALKCILLHVTAHDWTMQAELDTRLCHCAWCSSRCELHVIRTQNPA